ncbi:MAG: SurA N-terminal domain-containing protein [Candidatus Dormibacteria bacterium]
MKVILANARHVTRAALLTTVVALAACGVPGDHSSDAATVNGVAISRDAWQKVVDGSQKSLELRGIPSDSKTADGRRRLEASQVAALRELIREEVYQQMAREKNLSVSDKEIDQSIKDLDATLGSHAALEAKLDSAGQTDADLRHLIYVNTLRLKLRQGNTNFSADLDKRLRNGIQAYVGPCATNHAWPQCTGQDP